MVHIRHCLECEAGCSTCEDKGYFYFPSVTHLAKQCKGRKGLKVRKPKGARARYVWHMVRFNMGVEHKLPTEIRDPFSFELDQIAEMLTCNYFKGVSHV